MEDAEKQQEICEKYNSLNDIPVTELTGRRWNRLE